MDVGLQMRLHKNNLLLIGTLVKKILQITY